MNANSVKPNYTTNNQNYVEHPVRLLKFILRKLKVKDLFKKCVRDPRTRVDHYKLDSLLMFDLCSFLFRSPSKNKFHLNLKRPSASKSVAKFTEMESNRSPCPRSIDDIFLELNADDFSNILPEIFRKLCRQKIFQLHPELVPNREFTIAIDAQATHTYHEKSQHPCQLCPYCLKRTRGDKIWYIHYDLVASFVAPNGLQIPLLFYRIRARPEWGQLGNNKWKQECERTAFPILLRKLRHHFPRLNICVLLDALYATNSVFSLLKELKMGYSIVRKVKMIKTVGEDCEGLKSLTPPLQINKENKRFNVQQTIYFFNDVAYRQHKLSIIQLNEHAEKKPSKRFAKIFVKDTHWEWIVSQTLDKGNVPAISTQSRLRWNEEDLFNSLQCRGFAIRHDFSRAPTSQLIWSYLALIAYAISSILIHSSLGKLILSKGYTICFLMEQMLNDLIYLPDVFVCGELIQLRFGKDPPT